MALSLPAGAQVLLEHALDDAAETEHLRRVFEIDDAPDLALAGGLHAETARDVQAVLHDAGDRFPAPYLGRLVENPLLDIGKARAEGLLDCGGRIQPRRYLRA